MLADVAAVNASSPPTYVRGINFDVAKRATLRAAYYDSLRVCRIQQPGRVSRRVHLSTTQFGVTQCLRRRGWTSRRNSVARVATRSLYRLGQEVSQFDHRLIRSIESDQTDARIQVKCRAFTAGR